MSGINGLTDKQMTWVNAYLTCWNGAEAARQAGYESVYQSAHDNITNPKIQEVIRNRLRGQAMSANEVLNRLGEQARGDIGQFLGKGGVLDLEGAKEAGLTHLIKSLSWTKAGLRIELYSAQDALDKIGKAHGLFRERHEHSGPDGGPIRTKDETPRRALDPAFFAEVLSELNELGRRDSQPATAEDIPKPVHTAQPDS